MSDYDVLQPPQFAVDYMHNFYTKQMCLPLTATKSEVRAAMVVYLADEKYDMDREDIEERGWQKTFQQLTETFPRDEILRIIMVRRCKHPILNPKKPQQQKNRFDEV